ncbi:S8 family peptidase [Alkalihalobacillus deserti]|uniref:S8 family peptidase n=1 Tax=Alkalihalobacillus deserti TaxID=2879466 RepID=UPI001D146843|nr:S8 family peptidase [Alkalihalobacillus deserti]
MKGLRACSFLLLMFLFFFLSPLGSAETNQRYIIVSEKQGLKGELETIDELTILDRFTFEEKTYTIAEGASESIEQAKQLPSILYMEEDQPLQLVNQDVSGSQMSPWGILEIEANRLLDEPCRCKIAIIDSGISDHVALNYAVRKKITYTNLQEKTGVAFDDSSDGHGTHVAGIIAGKPTNGQLVGMTNDASLYIVKALDAEGNGFVSDMVKGIRWAMNEDVQLVNLSLGTDRFSQTMENTLKDAYDRGIVVVAASGNDGGVVQYPAASRYTIGVGATDQNRRMPSWSSFGSEVDLLAPGVRIPSTVKNHSFGEMSGTSMAAPHVTGAASKLLPLYQGKANGNRVEWVRSRLKEYSSFAYQNNGSRLQQVGFLNVYRSFHEVDWLTSATVMTEDGKESTLDQEELNTFKDSYNRIMVQTNNGKQEWQLN